MLLKIYDLFEHEVSYKLSRQAIKDTVLGYLRDEHIEPEDEYKTTDNYASSPIPVGLRKKQTARPTSGRSQ